MRLTELAYFTDDVPSMVAFYARLLDAEPVAASDDMAVFQVDETQIFIHRRYAPDEGDLPPTNHTALAVDDLVTKCDELVQAGLTLEAPPRDYYWGRSAYLRDPDGHQIELIQAPPEEVPGLP